jgi:acyl-CoA thioester hydrolase
LNPPALLGKKQTFRSLKYMQVFPARGQHIFAVRVYYEDTDFSGLVYHANYLRFFERARTELLRELGVDQVALFTEAGLGFVVRSLHIDYLKPARMDDYLRVGTYVERLGGASVELVQVLWRDEEKLTQGKVRLALIAGGRPQPIPADIRAMLGNIRGTPDEGARADAAEGHDNDR